MRKAKITRNTNETKIKADINLDGSGIYNINTGIGFLDHMIEQLSRHSLIDIDLTAKGDIHIDCHHTTEDCGYAIGMAFSKALGDKKGIERYGFSSVVMDEALSQVSLDLSSRPHLIWNVKFTNNRLGDLDTQLFKEWFIAFSQKAGITLHVNNIYGENDHHIIESCFKALARALRVAITIDSRKAGVVPSTKGVL